MFRLWFISIRLFGKTSFDNFVNPQNTSSKCKMLKKLFQLLLYPPDNLSPILCHAHVSWTWWTSSTGHVAVTEPFPDRVVVANWLKSHTRGMVPGVAPPSPTARFGHPGDVHSGLLKPISLFPWLRNGPIGPKVSYPNKKKYLKEITHLRHFSKTWSMIFTIVLHSLF